MQKLNVQIKRSFFATNVVMPSEAASVDQLTKSAWETDVKEARASGTEAPDWEFYKVQVQHAVEHTFTVKSLPHQG